MIEHHLSGDPQATQADQRAVRRHREIRFPKRLEAELIAARRFLPQSDRLVPGRAPGGVER
ncbi:MAG: hypothetical protein HYY79_04135 [Betaproteobacteria bacterium]|nr:hypothetical protein [Betaproteobacteria bacterium]